MIFSIVFSVPSMFHISRHMWRVVHDLVITKSDQQVLDFCVDPASALSDHSVVSWCLPVQCQPPVVQQHKSEAEQESTGMSFGPHYCPRHFATLINVQMLLKATLSCTMVYLGCLPTGLPRYGRSRNGAKDCHRGWWMNAVCCVAGHVSSSADIGTQSATDR